MNELTTSRYRRERDEARKTAGLWKTASIAYMIVAAAVLGFAINRVHEANEYIAKANACIAQATEDTAHAHMVIDRMQELADAVAVDPMQEEKEALAKMVLGEARGCDLQGQQDVVWTALARYDHGGYGDTLLDVISAPQQFQGYAESNPVEPEILAVVDGVVAQWLDGNPGPGWLFFEGDGTENHFRKAW